MPNRPANWVFLLGATLVLLNLQGCMSSSVSLPADEAFALSASALSGSENFSIDGEVSVFNPAGFIGSREAYTGEVTGHGNLRLQWKNASKLAASVKHSNNTSYQPLQLLESINDKTAVITYAEPPSPGRPVHFQIKLNETVSRERVIAGLRDDFALISKEDELLRGDPVKAHKIISRSKQRMEEALSTLRVTTVCDWTADPKNWFPSRLREVTTLAYTWDDKRCKEKRVSETNFLQSGRNGTMNKVNK